jgi:hypothetical protein
MTDSNDRPLADVVEQNQQVNADAETADEPELPARLPLEADPAEPWTKRTTAKCTQPHDEQSPKQLPGRRMDCLNRP